jgi:hypothetical protein
MKTRILSLRVKSSTIVYCYQLQEQAGRNVVGKPVSTIIGDTLEAIVEASRRMYHLPDMESDEQAEELLKYYADRIPGREFNGVAPIWSDERQNPAGKEKTGPAEASAPIEASTAIEAPTGSCVPVPIADMIQSIAADEEYKDEQAMVAKVDVGVIERVSPDIGPDIIPKCPWAGVPTVSEEEVKDDELYKLAGEENDLARLAVRVVYAVIPKEARSTAIASKLVAKTYGDYKAWEVMYGNRDK